MPELPSGARVRLSELSAEKIAASGSAATEQHSGSLGGRVWRSAAALCRWQLTSAAHISGSSVLELGGGTGACGIFAAGLGASRVVLTDGAQCVLSLMEDNVDANRHIVSAQTQLAVQQLSWGVDEHPKGRFDFVIASDVTPYFDTHAQLCQTLVAILEGAASRGETTRVIMCEEHGAPTPVDTGGEGRTDEDFRMQSVGRFHDSAFDYWQQTARQHRLMVQPLLPTAARMHSDGRHSWDAHAFTFSVPFLTEVTLDAD